jgi:hypothetical protein
MPFILFFTSGVGRWIVLAVIVSAALAFERQHLINEGRAQVLAENKVAAVKIIVRQGAITEKIVDHYHETQGKTNTVIQYVDREVVRYEAAKLDTCVLSNEFVRVFNDSTVDTVPNAAEGVDGSPSGITAANALPVLTSNNATYRKVADELRALQEWATKQQAAQPAER